MNLEIFVNFCPMLSNRLSIIKLNFNQNFKTKSYMKSWFKITVLLPFLLLGFYTQSQTFVSGGIYNNTTWTLNNSPYIVTGDIVLFPDKTLTVEPGVEVRFNGYFSLEIRGILSAIGTETDSIKFISNIADEKDSWSRIQIQNASQYARGFFEYCQIKNSEFGIAVECCWGNDESYIKHSLFENNSIASYNYAGWFLPFDHCLFIHNTTAIAHADKLITNSSFFYNETAVSAERYKIYNSVFENNDAAIDWDMSSGFGIIDSCIISNNNLGIRAWDCTITHNEITNNNIGLVSSHESWNNNGNLYYVPVLNNRICNNTQFNVINANSYNKDLTSNCFCTSDSVLIEEKLFDGYDDISLGLFNYSIFDTACEVVLETVYKVGNPLGIYPTEAIKNLLVYPNPFDSYLKIRLINPESSKVQIRIFNSLGKVVKTIDNISSPESEINTSNLTSGIYFMQILKNNEVVEYRKIIRK
jgi:hypothetical protein